MRTAGLVMVVVPGSGTETSVWITGTVTTLRVLLGHHWSYTGLLCVTTGPTLGLHGHTRCQTVVSRVGSVVTVSTVFDRFLRNSEKFRDIDRFSEKS